MTAFLPPNLLALFAPRDPIPYKPPVGKLTIDKKRDPYHGIASFVGLFEDPSETPEPVKVETREERVERKRKEKAEANEYKLEQDLALWDPHSDPNATGDPFKTLFVGRINYDTSESKLRREFESYGNIKRIRTVNNADSGKPRGYAFIEYEHERDMHAAYKHADGKKIDGRRVLVDVERARTVKGWLPRRLGGGLGGTRKGAPDECTKYSGREEFAPSYDERDRGGGGRGRRDDRRRSRSRDRRDRMDRERRDRDRERRDRGDRGDRDRSRERRRRSRSRDRNGDAEQKVAIDQKVEIGEDGQPIAPPPDAAKESRGDRDRDRERKRSRSRERKRKRSRSRDRKRRRSRSRGRGDRPEVKSEPVDPNDPDADARRIRMQEEMNAMMDQEEMHRAGNENGGWGGGEADWNPQDVKPEVGMQAEAEERPRIMDYGHGRGDYSEEANRGYGNGY